MRIGRIQCGLVGGERELLLARVAEDLLTATDERVLLESAIALLGDSFGYGMRYVLLYDAARGDLYFQVGAGPRSDDARGFRTKLGVGLTGVAAATRTIVNVGNVGADARFIATTDCVSEICVPLLSGADLIGVLSIQSPEHDAFAPDDERLLSAFATLCALAIGRVRADARMRNYVAEMQAVSEVARVATKLQLTPTIEAAVSAFQRITTSDSTAIYLWDETRQRLRASALVYEPRFYPGDYRENVFARELSLGEGMVGWAALHREPVLIDDVAKDPRPTMVSGVSLESKAAIVIPLVADDRLLGVIRAVKMGAGTYTPDHFRLAKTLADQAVLTIAATRAFERAENLALTDELTGLYNTRHFYARLDEETSRAVRHARSMALLLLDADGLKLVNDRFGHQEGDRLLQHVASLLRREARTSDIIARVGGDEFAVIQPETEVKGGMVAAERIRSTMHSEPFTTVAGDTPPTSLSIGVSGVPDHARSSADLFRFADSALYESKRAGKDRTTIATAVAAGQPLSHEKAVL
jgi:two-component system, cell cycle response regulator